MSRDPFHPIARTPMNGSSVLTEIRKRHVMLDALPEKIVIPAYEALRREQIVMALQDATIDDIAFAICGVEAEFNAVGDRLNALGKLYNLARQAGALGAERAIDVVVRDAGGL